MCCVCCGVGCCDLLFVLVCFVLLFVLLLLLCGCVVVLCWRIAL